MATIDPSIALGIKPVQIENPLAVQGRAMEGAVNALKYQDLQRATQEEQEVRNFLRSADLSKPETRAQLSQFGKTGLGYGKLLAEQEKAGLETTKLKGDINKQKLDETREAVKSLDFNPSDSNFKAYLEDAILKGRMTLQQAEQEFAAIAPLNTDQRRAFVKNRALTAEKLYSDQTTRRGQDITVRGQDLTYGAATQPVFSEASGGFYTRPTGNKPAEFIPAGGTDMTTKGKSVTKAKENVTTLASEMAKGYADLLEKKGIKSTEAGAASNLSASSQSSMVGQLLGSAFGTEEQDIRDYVKSQRPLLVQAMVKATGMSAQQINSNAELKNMLDAATDPSRGYESNIRALNGLNNMFGTGAPILPGAPAGTPPPAPASNINVPGVGPQLKVPGGAAPAARPSLDSIFGPGKK
jgi:hypothetical protein